MADKKSAGYKAAVAQLNDELVQGILREVDNDDLVRLGIDRVGIDQMTTLFKNPLGAQWFGPEGFDRAELEADAGYIGGGDVDLTKPTVLASVGNMVEQTPRQNRADIAHEYAHAGIMALQQPPELGGIGIRQFNRAVDQRISEEVIVRHLDISQGSPITRAESERYLKEKYPDQYAALRVKGEKYYNRLSDEAAKKLYDEGKRMSPDRQRAAELASRGRYGDSMLVHMNPVEVKAMHEASPMGLTINPDTGQPEAFLPLLGALAGGWLGGMAPAAWGLGAYGTALGSGLGATGGSLVEGRDPKDALMAGLLAGGTTAALGAFGDEALGVNEGQWGYSGEGVRMPQRALSDELALRKGTGYFTPDTLKAPQWYDGVNRANFASDPGYVKAYTAKPTTMDRISAPWGEGSPALEETFGRAVKNPAFYGGAAAAGLGAFGGGLDPLMGVPDTVIPEVEEDEPRGPNKHLGQNKVFWGKPASWTDADGEWQFYWPQGVTPPGYAHGGIVRAYQAGGAVVPGYTYPTMDEEARARGRERDWGFRTPDPVGLDAPVVDPLGADPLDTTLLPLLPVNEYDPQVSPARAPTPPEEQTYSFAASQRGFEEPTVSVPFSGLQNTATALGTAVPFGWLGVGGIKAYNAYEEQEKAKEQGFPTDKISLLEAALSPIGLTVAQQVARNERDRWATEQAGKPEPTAWGGWPQADLNSPGGAKAAADVLAAHLGGGGGDGGSAPSISTSAPQGAPAGYENAPEAFDWAQGGLIRGYAHGDMVTAPQAQQPQQPNPIVMGAIAAIKGQHPEPQKAVMAFVQTYGQPAFAQLRQQVIMAERQGAGLGSGAVRGPGDGLSDSVPANIDGQEPVALSDGEVVVPADVVSGLGNGSSEAGAQTLEDMNENVRQARTGKKNQPGAIDPMLMLPA